MGIVLASPGETRKVTYAYEMLSLWFTKKDWKQIEDKMIPALECTATVLNINYGQNKELLEKCRTLKEYSQFIAMIRKYIAEEMIFEEAVKRAVEESIKQGILAEILRKNRSEVIDMILTEYNEEEFRKFLKEESWKEGHTEGQIEGAIGTCIKFHFSREEILKHLMEEFALSQDDAVKYLEKYQK